MTDTNFDGIIDPAAAWPDVPQLATTAIALGGAGGPMNAQAVALTARQNHLKEHKANSAEVYTKTDLANTKQLQDTNIAAGGDGSALLDAVIALQNGRTQRDKNNEVVSLEDYLAKLGIAVTADISTALQQIATDGVKRLLVKSREYIINSTINFTQDIEFINEPGVVFNFGTTGSFYFTGSHTEIGNITSDIVKNSSFSFTLASSAGIAAGDWLILYCPTDYSFSPDRDYYRKGEFVEVASVVGNTVNFYGYAYDSYSASEAVKVLKVNPISVNWNNLRVKSSDTNVKIPVTIKYAKDFIVQPYQNTGGRDAGMVLYKCFGVTVNANAGRNSAAIVTMNYGLQFANCQKFIFQGGRNNATRHAVAIGGTGSTGDIPCRDGKICNATLHAFNATDSGADMHGNTEFITYDQCKMTYVTIGGSNNTIQNCDIYERKNGGCVYGSELRGGTYNLINNTYHTTSALQTSPMLHLIIQNQLRDDLTINVVGGTIKGAGGSNASVVQIRQSNSLAEDLVKKVNIKITGVTSELVQQSHWLWIDSATAGARVLPSDYLIVDNIVNTKATSVYLIQPSNTVAATKTRQMAQAGSVEVTSVVNNTATRAGRITLKYKYSKPPFCSVSISNRTGFSDWDATAFNEDITLDTLRVPVAANGYVTVDTVRPTVLWNKKVVTAQTFQLNYSVGINEV